MGIVGPGLMGTGGVLIAYGMVGPPMPNDAVLKTWSIGLGTIATGAGFIFSAVQGNDKGGKGKK